MKGCVFEKKKKNGKNQNEKGIENDISQSEESCFCYLRCDQKQVLNGRQILKIQPLSSTKISEIDLFRCTYYKLIN